jgi:hypothetical protein
MAVVALSACNPFHHGNAVEVSSVDPNLTSRWHANLATPADLAGAVQINGSATMAPDSKSGYTDVALNLANATPMPATGSYFVLVRASAANAETTVACGNLAPPTQ